MQFAFAAPGRELDLGKCFRSSEGSRAGPGIGLVALFVAIVATAMQLVGALCVRGYAKALWVREAVPKDMELVVDEPIPRPVREVKL
jgi:hypothetical protein